jgi:BirA family biotin operon repressor/biotin-[acetyl-CoA-carboxylase] ligase
LLVAADANTPAWPIRRLAVAASTQDLAIAAAQSGEQGPLIFTADRQTAGRGRSGRAWEAPTGNLNFSAMLRPGAIPLQAAHWSLLAGVAVFDAVAAHMPSASGLMLKWPNDLLLNGAKLAGILIDTAVTPSGLVDWIVIGVGVNIGTAPSLPDRATACLADAGIAVVPELLAITLASQLARWLESPSAETRQAWLDRAHAPGTALRVHQNDRVMEGIFLGLAEDGSLRLSDPGAGESLILSGEVNLVSR